MKRRLLSYLLLMSLLAAASAKEFQVNTRTSRNQANAAVATDEQGNFAVVWASWFVNKSNEIRGRRFAADGTPIDVNEFEINTSQAGNQKEPGVAMDAGGNFVVTWQGPGQDQNDIFAQRFEPNGQPLGAEFLVNVNTAGRQLHPRIAMSKTGEFVIVWENNAYWPSFDYFEVMFRLYDSNGTPVDTNTANLLSHCRYPDVAMDRYGNFAIVWMQDDTYHTSNLIMARQYNADGSPKAGPFEVSTGEFYAISHPSIAMDGTGHFVVTWEADPCSAQLNDIHARRYHFDGMPLCEQFLVNATTAGTQQYPKVAINSKRKFVIVWSSEKEPNSNEREIFGRRFDSSSKPIGDEFWVNTYAVGDQKYPDVAIKETAEFVAAWQSYGQDGSEYGIFADIGRAVPCADFTGDWFVNFGDYCIFAKEWLKDQNPLKTDLVDDNKIDQLDLKAFCGQWLRPCYDCNVVDIYTDGKIDFKDYCLWAQGYLQKGPFKGDITGNGTVDLADLKALVFHWAKTCE
jgi:hypothetical protein